MSEAPAARAGSAGLLARIALPSLAAAVASAAAAALSLPPWVCLASGLAVAAPLVAWAAHSYLRPWRRGLQALGSGVHSLREGDCSLRIAVDGHDEMAQLATVYNDMADALRSQRQDVYERELLLDTVLQGSPVALLLAGPTGHVAFANRAARALLADGHRMEGLSVADLLARTPAPLREAMQRTDDALVSVGREGDEEVYRVVQRRFQLHGHGHILYLLERLTPELRRREVEVWKRVIRVMSHELGNSLAPIRSLVRSAREVVRRPDPLGKLDGIFDVIEDRATHLAEFVEGYARFARLPEPRKQEIAWPAFLASVRDLYPFRLEGSLPEAPTRFDPAQLQQVLINLLKNAVEAGSPPGEITIQAGQTVDGTLTVQVRDRGPGMTAEAMASALVPFHSAKAQGRGVGLALSREILEAHGGGLRLENRPGGGLTVTCWLPSR